MLTICLLQYSLLQKYKFKRNTIPRQLQTSQIPGNMLIYILCSKYLKHFTKFHAGVKKDFHLQNKGLTYCLTDWHTDWLTDGRSKTYSHRNFIAWHIIIKYDTLNPSKYLAWVKEYCRIFWTWFCSIKILIDTSITIVHKINKQFLYRKVFAMQLLITNNGLHRNPK